MKSTQEFSEDHDDGSSPVFVVGYMHSGTTLLQNILARHSGVMDGGTESRLFQLLPDLVRKYPDLTNQATIAELYGEILQRYSATPLSDGLRARVDEFTRHVRPATHGVAIRVVLGALTCAADKRLWLEKTPTHIFYSDRIVEAIPKARFVEIVRDARDVLASKKTRRQTIWTTTRYRADQREVKANEKGYDIVWDSLSWRSAIHAGRQAQRKYPKSWHRVSYEQLVLDPGTVVRELCTALQLEFEDEMLDVRAINPADLSTNSANDLGISAGSVGRHGGVLSELERTVCERICRTELVDLGYRVTPHSSFGHESELALIVAKSSFEVPLRLYRRYKLRGPRFAAEVAAGYLRRLRVLLAR